MGTRHRTFSFPEHDTAGVIDEMRQFADGADGRRWVNLVPDAAENEIHTGSALWRVFSSRGPVIPIVTWYPAHERKGRREPGQVGIAHATGRGAVDRLVDQGLNVPAGWSVVQDHQKRGVIFTFVDDADPVDVITYGTQALRLLSPFGFEEYFLITFSQH